MRSTIVVAALCLSACGALDPGDPAPKGGGNNGATNNGATNNGTANNGATNNGAANNGVVDPDAWGTSGPQNANPKSPQGQAQCELADVKTDDLGQTNATDVPDGTWPDLESDAPGRCGDDLETLVWRLHNCERIGRGLAPYQCDLRLVWLGRQHSADMVARGYFRHENLEGLDPFERMQARGVSFSAAAENIGQTPTPIEAHWGWMDSAVHRGNILGSFEHAGVGVVPTDGGLMWTTGFVSP